MTRSKLSNMPPLDITKTGEAIYARPAPKTAEMEAFAAFLADSFNRGMDGNAMREAVEWSLGHPDYVGREAPKSA